MGPAYNLNGPPPEYEKRMRAIAFNADKTNKAVGLKGASTEPTNDSFADEMANLNVMGLKRAMVRKDKGQYPVVYRMFEAT